MSDVSRTLRHMSQVWLASTGIDGTVQLWNPADGAEAEDGVDNGTAVWAMDVGVDARGEPMLVCGGVDGMLRCWDPGRGRMAGQLRGHGNTISAIAPLRAGTAVAAADVDGSIKVWDLVGQREALALAGRSGPINGLRAFLLDGEEHLASAGGDGVIHLWHAASGRPVRQWRAHQGMIWSLAVLGAGGPRVRLASAGVDGRIHVWDPATGASAAPSFGHDKVVYDLAPLSTPGGERLVSAAIDGEIRIWDPARADLIHSYVAHEGPVRAILAVRAAGDGALLASGGGDGAVRLWRPLGGEMIAEFHGHWGSVLSMAQVRLDGVPRGLDREERAARIQTTGFADRAARVDLLGRGALVEVIVDLLGAGPARGDPDSGASVVSIEGPWGSGKTTVMQLVRQRLDQQAAEADRAGARRAWPLRWIRELWVDRMLTVAEADWLLRGSGPGRAGPAGARSGTSSPAPMTAWFNPWAHQSSEQVWAGLTAEILSAVGSALYPDLRRGERYWLISNRDRLDRRYFKRQMWKRLTSPLLRFSALAATVPIVAIALSRQLDPNAKPLTVFDNALGPGQVAVMFPLAVLALGLLHTVVRYLFGRASSFLPSELFRGPVLSGSLVDADVATRAALRDPLYDAKSGYLYLLQHDVRRVLRDIQESGRELIIFIDDLDRCGAAATAEVVEAINLFLSESFPRTRFIIGLDPIIVTAHIDETYSTTLFQAAQLNSDDPTPGWTFLRKIIQLPVVLPRVSDAGIARLLNSMLGEVQADGTPRAATGGDPATPTPAGAGPAASPAPAAGAPEGTAAARPGGTTDDGASPDALRMETHPAVRTLLSERLARQTDLSARHAKRLLNVWQFYVRLLDRVEPLTGEPAVARARSLVLVAEMITRWPAQLRWLRKPIQGRTGIQLLVGCRFDDVEWESTIARLGIAEGHAASLQPLRQVLATAEGPTAADLFITVV